MLMATRAAKPAVIVLSANVGTATAARSSIGDGWRRACRTAANPHARPNATKPRRPIRCSLPCATSDKP